jgi:hypothetical protein
LGILKLLFLLLDIGAPAAVEILHGGVFFKGLDNFVLVGLPFFQNKLMALSSLMVIGLSCSGRRE